MDTWLMVAIAIARAAAGAIAGLMIGRVATTRIFDKSLPFFVAEFCDVSAVSCLKDQAPGDARENSSRHPVSSPATRVPELEPVGMSPRSGGAGSLPVTPRPGC